MVPLLNKYTFHNIIPLNLVFSYQIKSYSFLQIPKMHHRKRQRDRDTERQRDKEIEDRQTEKDKETERE